MASPHYTFIDDFDGPAGSAPDPAKWTYDVGDGGWGNEELQVYTDSRENSQVDGQGHLVLRAVETEQPGLQTPSYTSARIKTQERFSQRYGHWEARLRINSTTGAWPAWWAMGENIGSVGWPRCGEIDMFEDFGHSTVESSIHSVDDDGELRSRSFATDNDSEFHTYRMDWTTDSVAFFRDGVRYGGLQWPNGEPSELPVNPDHPIFMLLNLAVGGNAGTPPRTGQFPIELVVDYVKVWA
jgi:beta-glucanase (GH16 family)